MQQQELSGSSNELLGNVIAYFPLKENNSDLVGGHTATDTDVLYNSDAGFFQNTADFTTSVNSVVKIDHASDLSFGDGITDVDFSISFIFNLKSKLTSSIMFLKKTSSSNTLREFQFYYQKSPEKILGTLFDEANGKRMNYEASVVIGTALNYFITITYDATLQEIQLYVNGVLSTGTTTVESGYIAMDDLGQDIGVGKSLANTIQSLDGYLFELVFYNKKLIADDVTYLKDRYDNGIPFL